jgi:hypothetical protein
MVTKQHDAEATLLAGADGRTRRPTRSNRIGLVCTAIMVMMAGAGGVANLAMVKFPLSEELGLPWFISPILGLAKVLAVVPFLTGRLPMLREWAYAGMTFELLGAAACHVLSGSPALHAAPALFDLSIVLASYFLWHRSRRQVESPTSVLRSGP